MKDLRQYKNYLIVDLEATCCDKQSIQRHEMETIEIGAVLVDAEDLSIKTEFQTFIKPVRHPILTEFCKQLTSIQQIDVENATTFPEALQLFKNWLYQYDEFLFCSWGDYDRRQIEQECQFHGVAYPFSSEHVNIKKLFSESQGIKKKLGMAEALKLARLPLEGTHHRGIDDAKNMAKLMPYILGIKKIER